MSLAITQNHERQVSFIPTSEKTSVKDKLAQATVEWITALHDSEKNVQINFESGTLEAVRQGIWYPSSHLQAMEKIGKQQAALKKYFDDRHAHICGYASPKHFEMIRDFGEVSFKGKRNMHFILKSGELPSDALKAAKVGLSIIDCGVACQIARYGALLDVLGERKFNILFGDSPKGQKMNIGYLIDDHLQPMQHFVKFARAAEESIMRLQFNKNPEQILGQVNSRPVEVGQLVEIKGVNVHRNKHPWRHDAGFNLICADATPGEQKYVGLGIKGTESEISEELLNRFNQDFNWDGIPEALRSVEAEQISAIYRNHKAQVLDQYKDEGFNPGSMQEFNFSLIEKLMKLPENKISMDFVRKNS